MEIYIVHRQGFYRKECGGVFSTEQDALNEAKRLIEGECDDYHWYEIRVMTLGAPVKLPAPMRIHQHICEDAGLYVKRFYRKGGVIFEDSK